MNWFTRRRLWTLAIIGFVIGAIEFLPAHLFEDRINAALPAPWRIAVSGTVWDGFGLLQGGQSPDALAVPLTWKFDPLALGRLRLAWKVMPASPLVSGQVKIGAGWQSIEIRDTALVVDTFAPGGHVNALSRANPLVAIMAPRGRFQLNIPADARLVFGPGDRLQMNGNARIKAENFGARPFGDMTLGNYELQFTGKDTAIDYVFVESSGALKIDGGGSIQTTAPRQIAYAGHMTPAPTLPENLLSRVKALGPATADGRIRVEWRGRW